MLKQAKKILKKEKGVTLVELLAVIIILGIIALIAVPAIAGVIEDSKYNSLKSSAINAIEAADLYKVTQDELPDSIGDLADYYDSKGVTWSDGTSFSEVDGNIVITGTISESSGDGKQIELTNASVMQISEASVSDENNKIPN
ncbi:prepilin-type N-terminal cleavage/methylation domain-containing protein [Piscibacillus halophilus]|uniref:Type IV pilus assembly protein PilA n=1 Tax=Piscibacillus halophilus TaxID=571933 RepID=A0A1H9GHE7_9BACI|nr:prepilin-type N-terminal cleavage/methylation domain-containing protein [Piscibacillus halophilus]SEQ49298.1 type IV pilus assembly protein PilA [Piscibacillus halophilus]